MNVVTLLPSATEIVCALGHEGALVGRSHECDFPHSVVRLPVCTEPKFSVEGSKWVRKSLLTIDALSDSLCAEANHDKFCSESS